MNTNGHGCGGARWSPDPFDDGQGSTMDYSAVIFDLDGTLLDSLADIAEAANRVLASRELPTFDVSTYRQFVGKGVRALMERALPATHQDPETIAAASDQFRRVYSQTWNLTTQPYPGIRELLTTLGQRGVKLAVLSNKPHVNTTTCVNEFFDATTFVAVLGQRHDIPCKPDPASALEIAEMLDITPDQTLFVGDSNVDMQTAVNSGMKGVGVSWGFRSREELLASGASLVIDHPRQLLDLVRT